MKPPVSINSIPLLGQQQQQAHAQRNAAIGHLAMQIYTQVAMEHVAGRAHGQSVDVVLLRAAALESVKAAKCYFEGLKLIPVEDE